MADARHFEIVTDRSLASAEGGELLFKYSNTASKTLGARKRRIAGGQRGARATSELGRPRDPLTWLTYLLLYLVNRFHYVNEQSLRRR